MIKRWLLVALLCCVASECFAQAAMRPDQFIARPWSWTGAHQNVPRQTLTVSGTTFTPPSSFGNYWITTSAANQTIACPTSISDGDQLNFHIQQGASAPFSPNISFAVPCYGWVNRTPPTLSTGANQVDAFFCFSMSPTDVTGANFICGPQIATGPRTPPALGAAVHGTVSGPTLTLPGLTSQGPSGVVDLIITVNPAITVAVSSPHLTWTLRASQAGGTGQLYEYYAPFTSALTSEVIVINNASGTFYAADAFEVKNAPSTSPFFDPNGALPALATTGNPAITTSNPVNMAICGFRMNTTPAPIAGSGWTIISGADHQLTEYQILSSPASGLSCTIGGGAVDQNAGIGDAIQ